jgi:hypothetical protein
MGFAEAKEPKNILVGAASLLMGPKGGSVTDVGYTRDGVTIAKAGDFLDVQPDQSAQPVLTMKTGETYTITTNLLEGSLDSLKLAWGEKSAIVSNKLSLGVEAKELEEYKLEFYGICPKNVDGVYGERKITFHRCVVRDYGEVAHTRDAETVIPITISALYDEVEGCVAVVEDTPAV